MEGTKKAKEDEEEEEEEEERLYCLNRLKFRNLIKFLSQEKGAVRPLFQGKDKKYKNKNFS